MAGSRRLKKHYSVPRKRWDRARIERERPLCETYGLKNKRELRRAETMLRGKRKNARNLLALNPAERAKREREIIASLDRMGLLKANAALDDVLSLSAGEFFERRLQTMVWRQNLASTIGQARQFIVHGHIAVGGRKVNCPGYLVERGEEKKISYYGKPMQLQQKKKEKARQMKEEALKAGGEGKAAEKTGATQEKPAEAETKGDEKPSAENAQAERQKARGKSQKEKKAQKRKKE